MGVETKIISLVCFITFLRCTFSSLLESNAPENPQLLVNPCNGQGRTSTCEVELDVPEVCVSIACPIVFFFHGAGGTNNWFARTTSVHEHGVIGVYPQGENGWNTGPKETNLCDWDDFECSDDPDEGAFIADIIKELRYLGATGNVYAVGNSNGAALALRLASNAGEQLPIKGVVTKVTQLLASPERSGPGVLNYNQPRVSINRVSILNIMGTADSVIPYEGGTAGVFGNDPDFVLMSALESMEIWADHNGCDFAHLESVVATSGDGTADHYVYTCPEGILLEHYAVNEGGHSINGSIDGDEVDYKMAYDFIFALEHNSPDAGSPVTSPIKEGCKDDAEWHGKFDVSHNCDYVALNPEIRCNFVDNNNISASVACIESCGSCGNDDEVPSPPPVSLPVAGPEAPCEDDFDWYGKYDVSHNCDYVALQPEIRCNFVNDEDILASVACLKACGSCGGGEIPVSTPVAFPTSEHPCVDDPDWHGKFSSTHDCHYVSDDPNNRCNWESEENLPATQACPVTCGTCVSPSSLRRNLRQKPD